MFRILYPIFDKTFIHDSYSCREGKGVHRGVLQLEEYVHKASANYTCPLYALKCDIKKFFDSVSHKILFDFITRKINDPELLSLILSIIKSFETRPGYGLPLGNVTSQLFANIYLNELDHFVKRDLKARYYLRYCDDFVILDNDKEKLFAFLPPIRRFLAERLHLSLHPHKVSLRKASQGIDFLGYVVLPHYRVLRTKTKHRMLRKIRWLSRAREEGIITDQSFCQSLCSYLGMLMHCEGRKIEKRVHEIVR